MKKRCLTFFLALLLCTTLISCFPTYDSRYAPLYDTVPSLLQKDPKGVLSFAYYRNSSNMWVDESVDILREKLDSPSSYRKFNELTESEQELYQYVTLPQRIFGPFTIVLRTCAFKETLKGKLNMIYYQTTKGNYILYVDKYDDNQLYLFTEEDYCTLKTKAIRLYRIDRIEDWESTENLTWEDVIFGRIGGDDPTIGDLDSADLSPYKIEPRAITWWQCALIDIAKVGVSALAIALIIHSIRKIRKRKQEKQQQATESAPTEG